IGKHHRVYGNYFQGLTNGIIIRNGWKNPPPYSFPQVDDAQIENNTLVDCRQSVVFGWDKEPEAVLPAVNSTLSANVFVSDGPPIIWTNKSDQQDSLALVFDDNISIHQASGSRFSAAITGN